MRIRGANAQDYESIRLLYEKSNFILDAKHLERLIVVEDEHGIAAVGSLGTILEASFVVDTTRSRKTKVLALTALSQQVDTEVKIIGYDHVNAFATNESIIPILKDKLGFVKTKAIQVLVKLTS